MIARAARPAAEVVQHVHAVVGADAENQRKGDQVCRIEAVPEDREAAKRGLGYLDDGLAPRSVAPTLAAGQAMPFAKADLSIDAVPTSVEIDRALAKLENLAKERGTAIGIASALPISIERIGVWIKALESHGIMLVPLTTAMLKSKSG